MSHCEYANLTWAELVGDSAAARPPGLKRLDVCLRELSANPSYYLSRHLKKDWHFFEVGEDYFVTNGHHRSVVGRLFLELNELSSVVHGVHVMEVDPADWARAQHEWEKGGPPERWTAPGNAGDSFEHGVDGERV